MICRGWSFCEYNQSWNTIFQKAGTQVADDLGLVEEADEEEEEYSPVRPLLSHSSGDRLH
jgi:hypothetical protein